MANKKLIFCFDGTCNDPEDAGNCFDDGSITNVLKLHLMLGGNLRDDEAKIEGQRSLYFSGVGTYGGKVRRIFNTLFAPSLLDVSRIMRDAFERLEEHNKAKDSQILVFGFSRGAAIARRFASEIKKRHRLDVEFLGVFDTVAAMGGTDINPKTRPASDVVFENGTVGEHVKKAVHLVALDERRIGFQPTLFNKCDRVLEVWFPGAHADVGGGYWFDGLSDNALEFMIEQAKKQCPSIEIIAPDQCDLQADSNDESESAKVYVDDLAIHPMAEGTSHAQSRSGLAKNTLGPRKCCVHEDDQPAPEKPLVHHSVKERFNKICNYRPVSLRNLDFKVLKSGGETSDCKGISGLRSD